MGRNLMLIPSNGVPTPGLAAGATSANATADLQNAPIRSPVKLLA